MALLFGPAKPIYNEAAAIFPLATSIEGTTWLLK
jgi:hypothetical protein